VSDIRLPRCRVLDRRGNRCCNEAVGNGDWCAHHMAAAVSEYRDIVAARTRVVRMPGGSVRVAAPEA
jgi:hypothetical protein